MDAVRLQRSVRGITMGLGLQFILGVMLASVVGADDTAAHQSLAHNVTLGLHIIIGIALMVGAIANAVMARSMPGVAKQLWSAATAVIVAFIGGAIVLRNADANWAVLVMGLGFIVAVALYSRVGQALAAQTKTA